MKNKSHRTRHRRQVVHTGLFTAFLATAVIVAVAQSACADGLVRCWGLNSNGQCDTPSDLGTCSRVAAGSSHTIAIRTDGYVRCWGSNSSGQCNVPADLGICSSIAGGSSHTVAIRSDGTVRCWGSNSSDQCNTPADLGACSSVAGGMSHTVALRSDGIVRCWGWNGYGQCNTPADLGPCSSVAGGFNHTIALRSDGGVRCWGFNNYGQCNPPVNLGPCSSVVGAKLWDSTALQSDGTVRCWGRSSYVPADLGTCSSIAGGYSHTIALRSDGTVRCWGDNNFGQLNIPPSLTFLSVAGGGSHTIALQSEQCTGDLNHDTQVNGADLGVLLGQWASSGGTTGADLNLDGVVNGADLGFMLGAWGSCSVSFPNWATVIEAQPDPLVVTDPTMRAAITAIGLPWRVRDTATQIEMLLVPPGNFTMGCTASNGDACTTDETPAHPVFLTGEFYMGRYEVTQAQWMATMGSNSSYFQGASYPDASNRPVDSVSWNTIQGYLGATGMRLATEAEWEYACRAGTTTSFNNGSSDDATVGTIAWYFSNSGSQTHAVGGKAANALGLYDMEGNVWEWVFDWYGAYSASTQSNPNGPVSGTSRVLRGGSWSHEANRVYSSSRGSMAPGYTKSDIGFRVVKNP
jgi:formylglycine-generating enzyme required for sulfatase activity